MFTAKLFKSSHLFAAVSAICISAQTLAQIETERLWLPDRYERHFLDLKKAAEAAENLQRCVQVLSGTIDIERSVDHPVYRILCRQENGRSYNEMVDGLTFETTTIENLVPPEPTAEELEAQRLEEERQQALLREKRRADLWGVCDKRLQEKVALMSSVVRLNQNPPEPEVFEDNHVVFIVDFDAKDGKGADLKYRAHCDFSTGDVLKIKISSRRDLSTN